MFTLGDESKCLHGGKLTHPLGSPCCVSKKGVAYPQGGPTTVPEASVKCGIVGCSLLTWSSD